MTLLVITSYLVFSRPLQCNVRLFLSYVVCRLSVTRVYCDKTAEARIMQFSLECSTMR